MSVKATLYDYQRAGVNFIKSTNRCGLFLDIGLGKAIDNNTQMITPDGIKTAGEIKVGDYLYDRKGNPTKVLAVYPHKQKRAFKVTLKDGRSFICCDEHLIPYYETWDRKTIKVKPLGEMLDNYKRKRGYAYSIPQNEAVKFKASHHVIHPYVIGMLLGKGISNRKTFTADTEIKQKLSTLMPIPQDDMAIQKELERLHLYHVPDNKIFIPAPYLFDSIENRKALLKGFMDANGYVSTKEKHAFYYSHTKSKQLSKDIQMLCLSLGYGVTIKETNKKDAQYTINIYTPDVIVSRSDLLAKRKNRPYNGSIHQYTSIVDIKEVEPRDMTCFTVDNTERLYLINDFIVTHNTLITLTALTELAQENKLYGHILVVAPKRIALNTWPDEILKWEHTKNARFKVLAGLSKKKRDKLLDEVPTAPPTIYIINRELIPKLVARFPVKKWPFPNVVIDEAQSFKGYNTQGFKALKTIAPYTHYWIELTGTPSPNGLMDIWSLIYLIDGGKRLGKNITAYRTAHFIPGRRTPEGYPYEWWLKEGHDQQIHHAIKDVAISMMKKDYLSMPDITHNVIELEMTDDEYKVYKQLKKDKVLPLIDGEEIEASNAAVLSGALLQLSNGAIYAGDAKNEIIELHDHKLKALEEIIEGSNGQPILCFYWYKHDLIRLKKRFPEGEVFGNDPEQLKRWNHKKIPLLFAHPASAGHGINFQYGGHIMVFFVIPRSLELYEQSIGRLYRNGQNESVIVHYLKMRGTIEDRVIHTLIDKQLTQQALIDAVKADIKDLI